MRSQTWQLSFLAFALVSSQSLNGVDVTEGQLRDGLTRLAGFVASEVPKNARWALISSARGRFGIFSREEDVFSADGNAFLFDEKHGVEARIMTLHDGSIYPVKAAKDEGNQDDPGMSREFHASWKNADAAKDVAAAVEWLKKEAKKASEANDTESNPFGSRHGNNPAASYAASRQTALFWAALLFHTGQEKPAMSLATTALAGTDEAARKVLLDALFNRFGSQAYNKVMQDFAKHRDWNKLSVALDALVKRFPQGWQSRDAVRVFHHHVVDRAKLPAEPPLKTKTRLSAADQKLLLAWFKELQGGKQAPYEIWTLPAVATEDGDEPALKNEMETAFPRSLGLAAVPLLASLLTDDTLILMNVGGRDGGSIGGSFGGGDDYPHSYFGGSGRDATDLLRNSYNYLPQKPPTRAHLAWAALQRVLPQDLQNMQNTDFAEAIPDILAWHASVKNATPADLALVYLESGQNDETVLAHAVKTDDPKKLARLEGAMLEDISIYELDTLEPFITALGAQRGPSFLAKVRQKLEADLSRDSDPKSQERQRKQMDTHLKRLEAAAKGEKKTPDLGAILTIAADYDPESAGEDQMEFQDAFRQLPKLMQKLTAPARIEAIAQALPSFKSPQFAAQMIDYAFEGDGSDKVPDLKPEEKKAVFDATKDHWKKILDFESTDENLLLQTKVVNSLQKLTGIESDFPIFELTKLGDRGSKIIHEQGTAILAGQKPAPLPNPKSINSDQREKLLAEWGAKSPADIATGLETLPLDQIIALNDTIERSKDIPAGLKSHISTILQIKVKNTDAAPWQSWKGKSFTKETILALAREISATKSAAMLTVTLQRTSPLSGFTLHIIESKTLDSGWQASQLRNATSAFDDELPKNIQRVCVGFFAQDRAQANLNWFDTPSFDIEKSKPDANENLERMHNQARDSWQKILKVLETPKTSPVSMIITTAPVTLLQAEE